VRAVKEEGVVKVFIAGVEEKVAKPPAMQKKGGKDAKKEGRKPEEKKKEKEPEAKKEEKK